MVSLQAYSRQFPQDKLVMPHKESFHWSLYLGKSLIYSTFTLHPLAADPRRAKSVACAPCPMVQWPIIQHSPYSVHRLSEHQDWRGTILATRYPFQTEIIMNTNGQRMGE